MSRTRLAVALGVLAGACVIGTGVLALTTYAGDDPAPPDSPVVVTDPASGATLEVPRGAWQVRPTEERVVYGEVSVRGPALLDQGYCSDQPTTSFRALAAFSGVPFDRWLAGVVGGARARSAAPTREQVVLADGTAATYEWVVLPSPGGPCAAPAVEVAVLRVPGVQAVVVADTAGPGTLTPDEVRRILTGLQLP